RVDRIFAAHFRNVRQRFTGERFEFVRLKSNQQNFLRRTGGEVQIFPFVAVYLHLSLNLLARSWIAQTFEQGGVTAVFRPRRQTGVEPRAGGGVRVHVRADVHSFFLRAFDSREQFVFLWPIFLASGFDVVNLGRNVRFARDPQ